jgi:hypothetical protein
MNQDEAGRIPMTRKIVLMALLPLAMQVQAAPSARQIELGQELARLTGAKSMYEAYLKQCLTKSDGGPYDPRMAYAVAPKSFGAITPQSSQWPELEAISWEFQQEVCGYLTPEAFQALFAKRYAELNSEEDLAAAVAFHSSPAGKRLLANQLRINTEFQVHAQDMIKVAYKKSYARLMTRLNALMLRHQARP